jgi:thaumarchaeosortase
LFNNDNDNNNNNKQADISDNSNKKNTITTKLFGFSPGLAVILILIAPILFTLIVFPNTFSLSWNQGRGGFLFAMAFIVAELIGLRHNIPNKRFYIVIGLSTLTVVYFIALPLGLRDSIIAAAPYYKVHLVYSWEWMWDFIIMSIYVGSSLGILFGKKWYKIAPAGVIYLVGSTTILSLDTFFPYDSLGPLQFIVPIYLQIDQRVIGFIDNHIINVGPDTPASSLGNLLMLNGLHGPFALQVFWPSAGVHSMIIYTLVMLAFLLKMEIPLERKLVYFAIGIIGTATVNLIRIISLSLFALLITTNVSEWESFHSVAGEIMFLPWLGIYLASVMYLESKTALKFPLAAESTTTMSTFIKNPNPSDNNNNNRLQSQGRRTENNDDKF